MELREPVVLRRKDEAYTSVGVPSSDAAFLSSVVEGGTGGHMPAGGDLARGAALTTKAAASATAESGGLLNRLREAGQDLAQWRPDPHAMGSGFLPLTRKAPSAPKVAEAAVSGAPVKNVFDANSYAHLSSAELKSLYPKDLVYANTHPLVQTGPKSAGLLGEEGQFLLNTSIPVKGGLYVNFTRNGELVRFVGKTNILVNGETLEICHGFKVGLKELKERNLHDIQKVLEAKGLMNGKGNFIREKVNEHIKGIFE